MEGSGTHVPCLTIMYMYSTGQTNLYMSVEYERFYSQVGICETRELVLKLYSKTKLLVLEGKLSTRCSKASHIYAFEATVRPLELRDISQKEELHVGQ